MEANGADVWGNQAGGSQDGQVQVQKHAESASSGLLL